MSISSKIKHLSYQSVCAKLHKRLLYIFGLWTYPSYWKYRVKGKVNNPDFSMCYFTARPNPGAGIGHQMGNWNAGYWWAKQFNIRFAYIPFSTKSWDDFLGFGEKEPKVSELKKKGWIIRRIPSFPNETDSEIQLVKDIMSSYSGKKVIFLCEQDQCYKAQYGVMENIKEKFYSAPARTGQELKFEPNFLNIAIHVRRGDIMIDSSNPNLAQRYQCNDYFEKVLHQVVDFFSNNQKKPLRIYFFSQGKPEDYPEFSQYNNLVWCMDMGAKESFLHMVYADVLITSKSSFSYKPALLNKGIKVCPQNFWHDYPTTSDWVLCSDEGLLVNRLTIN